MCLFAYPERLNFRNNSNNNKCFCQLKSVIPRKIRCGIWKGFNPIKIVSCWVMLWRKGSFHHCRALDKAAKVLSFLHSGRRVESILDTRKESRDSEGNIFLAVVREPVRCRSGLRCSLQSGDCYKIAGVSPRVSEQADSNNLSVAGQWAGYWVNHADRNVLRACVPEDTIRFFGKCRHRC